MAQVTLKEIKDMLDGIHFLINCYPEMETDYHQAAARQISRLKNDNEACAASQYWQSLTN